MAGRDAEAAVERVLRPGDDPAEAAARLGSFGGEEVQLVEALLAEGQRALGAVHLEFVLHLAPGGEPVGLDRSARAACESDEGAGDVVDLDPAHPAPPVGALGDHGDAVAHHGAHRPEQALGRRQRMAADVGERAAAGALVAEGEGRRGVGHVVLGVHAAVAADLAELARRDHLPRQLQHRIAQIVEPDLGRDPRRLGRLGHLARLRGERGERLLAVDVLARGDRREGHLAVQRVGGGHADDVDPRIGDHRPPVRRGAREAELRRRRGGGLFGDVGDGVERHVEGEVERPGRRGVGEGVGAAHEAGSDQPEPQRPPSRSHRSAPR